MTAVRQRLLVGQLAKAAGVKPDSVRFYERSGLLPKAERLASGYRAYDEAALRRLRFIKKAQALGFSLDEIRRILRLRSQGQPACDCVMRMQFLDFMLRFGKRGFGIPNFRCMEGNCGV